MHKALIPILIALGAAGCEGAGLPFNVDDRDLSGRTGPDLGPIGPGGRYDLWMWPLPPDLSIPVGSGTGVTGEPCKASADCKRSMAPGNSSATCTKSNMVAGHGAVIWPDGYCQSPCRPAKNDANGINNSDCPGDSPVCAGSGASGTCYAGCTSINDCRDQYVCANITGTPTAACVPTAATECDPPNDPRPSGRKCGQGSRCVDYSPDNSYGGCAEICDPVAQGCPPAMSGANGCIVDFDVNDGSGDCITVNENNFEGAPCIYLNDCPAGAMCYGQKCRNYCRIGGKACPQGQTCKDITLSGRTVKFKANITGICAP